MDIYKCDNCDNESVPVIKGIYKDGDLCECGGIYRPLTDEKEPVATVPCSDGVIKPFPIQDAESIPLWLAEKVHEGYVKLYGDTQSLERIRQRGGFYRHEVVDFIKAI